MSTGDGDGTDEERTRPLGWGEQPYGGPPHPPQYGQGYGHPGPPPPPPYATRPDHPQAVTALVLGIVGLVFGLSCGIGLLVSPAAWVVGSRALRDIRASGGTYGGEPSAKAGQVMGIVGTVLLALAVLALVLFLVVGLSAAWNSGTEYGNV